MKRILFYIFGMLLLLISRDVYSQNSTIAGDTSDAKEIIQFSGLVVGGDSLYGIPGVTIYIPKSGRGTMTSSVGYFSLPVLFGDSVVIRSLGFKDKHLIIPESHDGKLSVIVELMEDTLLLPSVEILPWPTERLFKEAFLSMKLPHQDLDNMHKNLNEQVMKRMMYHMDQDGTMNHKYYMQQQVTRQENKMMYDKYMPNLFNPFAWAKFINQIKKGEHKNKAKDYQYEDED